MLGQGAQGDVGAHRMAQHQDRPGGFGGDDGVEEELQVGDIGREIVDMALSAVGQRPVGQALAAPVHGEHAIVTVEQFADDLCGVFLNEFGAAPQ